MKKSLIVILAIIMAMTCLFAGCEGGGEPKATPKVAGVPEEPAAATSKIDVKKTKGKEYTTIEFGKYPAAELNAKKEADLIEALGKIAESEMDSVAGYFTYEGKEYQKEIKIVKDPETGLDVTEVHWFEVSPISWIVLDESDNKLFVIAEENVNAIPFNKTPEDTNWAISSLRDWLNGLNEYKNGINFYNSAFSAEEKSVIVTQETKTGNNPFYKDVTSGEDVKDRVSLLSIEDFDNVSKWSSDLFAEDKDGLTLTRACGNTEYAIFKGAAQQISYDRTNSSWYWLRNSGVSAQNAIYVNELGNVIPAGYTVSFPQIGVRPTLVLDAANLNIK